MKSIKQPSQRGNLNQGSTRSLVPNQPSVTVKFALKTPLILIRKPWEALGRLRLDLPRVARSDMEMPPPFSKHRTPGARVGAGQIRLDCNGGQSRYAKLVATTPYTMLHGQSQLCALPPMSLSVTLLPSFTPSDSSSPSFTLSSSDSLSLKSSPSF